MRPKSEIYTSRRDDEHPSLFIWDPPPPPSSLRAPPLHIATFHQRENLSMSLIHLAGLGNCCHLHWLNHYIHQILAGLHQSDYNSFLTHFMLVQIFMGSSIFIHSAPTRASFVIPYRDITGYRVFSCDVFRNWALLSLKRFLLFRRKNKVTDHVSESPLWDLTFYLSGPSTTSFQLLQYCLGRLWSNFAGQTAKTKKQSSQCPMTLMSTIYLNSWDGNP